MSLSSLQFSSRSFSSFAVVEHSRPIKSLEDSSVSSSSVKGDTNNNKEQSATLLLTRTMVHRMRKSELQVHLQQRHLDTSGNKTELLERLLQTLPPRSSSSSSATVTTPTDSVKRKSIRNNPQRKKTIRAQEEATIPLEEVQILPDHTYILNIKGLTSTNSTGAGMGMVLRDAHDPDTELWSIQKYLVGARSVFEAEYSALVMAIRYAVQRGIRNLWVQLDNDVIVQQIDGHYKVQRESLVSMYWQVMHLQESLHSFRVSYLPKNDNTEATVLAIQALATGKNTHAVDDTYDPMKDSLVYCKKVSTKRRFQTSPSEETTDPTNSALPLLQSLDPAHSDTTTGNPTSSPHMEVYTAQELPVIDPLRIYRLQFDGGARGHPHGIAGAGAVLYDGDHEIWCAWKYLGSGMTNNVAEYHALMLGLQCAQALGIRRLRAQGDSELIVKQILGRYQVRSTTLRKLWKRTLEMIRELDHFEAGHVRREYNKRADWLANHAMDNKHSFGVEETLQLRS
jgi:ribonuclease HI